MTNQEIRDAVDKLVHAVLCGPDHDWRYREAILNEAKRLFPLSKPREVRIGPYVYRWNMRCVEIKSIDGKIWQGAVADANTLLAYDQLKTLGFTEEE